MLRLAVYLTVAKSKGLNLGVSNLGWVIEEGRVVWIFPNEVLLLSFLVEYDSNN